MQYQLEQRGPNSVWEILGQVGSHLVKSSYHQLVSSSIGRVPGAVDPGLDSLLDQHSLRVVK